MLNLIILIDCGFALKKVPLTSGSEAVSIIAHESVDHGSNAIPEVGAIRKKMNLITD